jgi:aminopeptidase N
VTRCREEYLITEDTQTIRIFEFTMTTICHELGHQWTGDLVTLDWWSHTWLNEGFADYFENYICSEVSSARRGRVPVLTAPDRPDRTQIHPDWKLRDKAVVADHHRGMELDAMETQHAMSSPVSTPEEDETKFDRISYSKGETSSGLTVLYFVRPPLDGEGCVAGGAVIRMWENMLGLDVLKKGMHRYLSIK